MTRFRPHDRVEITSDRFAYLGVPLGSVGYVLALWSDNAVEVEVMYSDGSTLAQFVAYPEDLRLASKRVEEPVDPLDRSASDQET